MPTIRRIRATPDELAAVPPRCGSCWHWTPFPGSTDVGECTALPPVLLFDQEAESPVIAERQAPAERRACIHFKPRN